MTITLDNDNQVYRVHSEGIVREVVIELVNSGRPIAAERFIESAFGIGEQDAKNFIAFYTKTTTTENKIHGTKSSSTIT
jgi:hypothetical protein